MTGLRANHPNELPIGQSVGKSLLENQRFTQALTCGHRTEYGLSQVQTTTIEWCPVFRAYVGTIVTRTDHERRA